MAEALQQSFHAGIAPQRSHGACKNQPGGR
jgi:hypothetical protein